MKTKEKTLESEVKSQRRKQTIATMRKAFITSIKETLPAIAIILCLWILNAYLKSKGVSGIVIKVLDFITGSGVTGEGTVSIIGSVIAKCFLLAMIINFVIPTIKNLIITSKNKDKQGPKFDKSIITRILGAIATQTGFLISAIGFSFVVFAFLTVDGSSSNTFVIILFIIALMRTLVSRTGGIVLRIRKLLKLNPINDAPIYSVVAGLSLGFLFCVSRSFWADDVNSLYLIGGFIFVAGIAITIIMSIISRFTRVHRAIKSFTFILLAIMVSLLPFTSVFSAYAGASMDKVMAEKVYKEIINDTEFNGSLQITKPEDASDAYIWDFDSIPISFNEMRTDKGYKTTLIGVPMYSVRIMDLQLFNDNNVLKIKGVYMMGMFPTINGEETYDENKFCGWKGEVNGIIEIIGDENNSTLGGSISLTQGKYYFYGVETSLPEDFNTKVMGDNESIEFTLSADYEKYINIINEREKPEEIEQPEKEKTVAETLPESFASVILGSTLSATIAAAESVASGTLATAAAVSTSAAVSGGEGMTSLLQSMNLFMTGGGKQAFKGYSVSMGTALGGNRKNAKKKLDEERKKYFDAINRNDGSEKSKIEILCAIIGYNEAVNQYNIASGGLCGLPVFGQVMTTGYIDNILIDAINGRNNELYTHNVLMDAYGYADNYLSFIEKIENPYHRAAEFAFALFINPIFEDESKLFDKIYTLDDFIIKTRGIARNSNCPPIMVFNEFCEDNSSSEFECIFSPDRVETLHLKNIGRFGKIYICHKGDKSIAISQALDGSVAISYNTELFAKMEKLSGITADMDEAEAFSYVLIFVASMLKGDMSFNDLFRPQIFGYLRYACDYIVYENECDFAKINTEAKWIDAIYSLEKKGYISIESANGKIKKIHLLDT